ncbi:hypothetical protein LEP1GSC043_2372 [Leptospira weilii str. Ecochallenge]|uniref:HEAT repeat protein n=1 Tax=Leptospira weilii str. Ecochallenge TaxID=1049986 RepID=N1UB44_9LEPT|nr:hypothetical protein LEP1GSC043_2372 [Leptospira weilii str. Ecochallenge]
MAFFIKILVFLLRIWYRLYVFRKAFENLILYTRTNMSNASLRDQVARLATTDPEAAYERAKRIDAPWYRTQALSHVAKHMRPDAKSIKVLKESLQTAKSQDDPYAVCASSAWPIAVLIQRAQYKLAATEVKEAFSLSARIENRGSRAHALLFLPSPYPQIKRAFGIIRIKN